MAKRDKKNRKGPDLDRSGWDPSEDEYITPYDLETEDEEIIDSVEDSDTGYLMVDTDLDDSDDDLLEEEDTDDYISVGTNPDGVMGEIDDFTDDEDVLDDFSDRQQLNRGSNELLSRLRDHHSKKPSLSGGDLDASWEDSDVSGEQSVGGTNPTPDQDVVEELGEAFGIDYAYDEPLDTYGKLRERDRNRWELDPASADEDAENLDDDFELDNDTESRDEI